MSKIIRTQEEIDAEITVLEELKPKVVRYGFLGDNWAAIGVQISVLRNKIQDGAIYDAYEYDLRLLENALEAEQWLHGEVDTLAEEWKVLIRD